MGSERERTEVGGKLWKMVQSCPIRERERGLRSIAGWREKFCVVRQPIQFISGLMGERECVCV